MIRVSVRFNGVSVRVIKQGIVPCKLLIAASAVFVFRNITDATPIFHQVHTAVYWSGKQHRPASMKALIYCEIIALLHKPQHLRYFFNREPRYLIQLCISGIVIRAFIAILIR